MSIQEFRADYLISKFNNSHDLSGSYTPLLKSILPIFGIIAIFVFMLLVLRRFLSIKKSFSEKSILLELTPPALTEKTAYTTQQLFSVIHNLGKQRSFLDKLIGKKILFACEIASTQNLGIKYLIRVAPEQAGNLKRS
jgi:hypothetical protein